MQTVRIVKKTEADGSLCLRIPLENAEAEYEVLVIVQPRDTAASAESRGWPEGYFESTYGSIDDETFIRPPQGSLPGPVEFD